MAARQEKNKKHALRPVRVRAAILGVGVTACLCLLCVQLFTITVVQNESWKKKAVSQQLADVEVTANRGQIYDRNGAVLALTLNTAA